MSCLQKPCLFKLILGGENVLLNLCMANLSKITKALFLSLLRCKLFFSISLFVRRIFHLHMMQYAGKLKYS